jgi:HK97 family phage portal protein
MRDTYVRAELEARDNGWTAFKDLTTPVYAGVSVTQDNAVNLPAVYKCVSLNAETISSLPIDVYTKRGDTRIARDVPAWLRDPNPFQTTAEFIAMTQTSLDLAGNAYWLKASAGDQLVGLSVLAPSAVQPEVRDCQVYYRVSVAGGADLFPSTAIVHLRGLVLPGTLVGLSPIECAKQTIGIGLASEQFAAQYYGNGIHPSGFIESPTALTKEQSDRLKEDFTKRHGGVSRSHALGVLTGGASFRSISVTAEDSQFLQSRAYTATEIANLYGVPTELVAATGDSGAKGYVTALHTRLRLWYLTGLLPRITRIETALSGLMVRPAYVKFNTNALLRMDPAERVAFYQAAQQGEWILKDEIRALEDMDPMPDGKGMEPLRWQQWKDDPPPDAGATDDSDEAATSGLSSGGAE